MTISVADLGAAQEAAERENARKLKANLLAVAKLFGIGKLPLTEEFLAGMLQTIAPALTDPGRFAETEAMGREVIAQKAAEFFRAGKLDLVSKIGDARSPDGTPRLSRFGDAAGAGAGSRRGVHITADQCPSASAPRKRRAL